MCAPHLAFPSCRSTPSTMLFQKTDWGSVSPGASVHWVGSGAPHWLGCCCQEVTYSSALCCPTHPDPCSLLSPAQTMGTLRLHSGLGCRHTFLGPSPFGALAPSHSLLGKGLEVQPVCSPAPCLDHAWPSGGKPQAGKVLSMIIRTTYLIASTARH